MTTTHHTTQHVTIPVQVDKDELLNNIMGSAWETWSWWRTATYADGYDWDTYPDDHDAHYITVGASDPDADEDDYTLVRLRNVTVNDILRATATILTDYPRVRWDDMDACDGDLVMQTVVLGEVVYG